MHAHWFNTFGILLGLTLVSGCMVPQLNGDPEVRSQRLGFREGESAAGEARTAGGESQPATLGPKSQVPSDQTTSAASNTETEKPVIAEQQTPLRPLGTAHTAQRAPTADTESTAHAEAGNLPGTNSETAFSASQLPSEQQEQALMSVVAELEAMGELDPETKRQLIADLRETKPALWQPMLGIYRLALASRKRADAQQTPVAPPAQALASDNVASSAPPATLPATVALAQPVGVDAARASVEATPPAQNLAQRPSPLRPARGALTIPNMQPLEQSDSEVQAARYEAVEEELAAETVPRTHRDRGVRLAAATTNAELKPRKTTIAATSGAQHRASAPEAARAEELADWQAYLEESILLLEEETPGPARTAEEVRRQAELRLLYLAGGDREAALRPIVGISTTQQEFWSEGLFALATYLDAEALPDGPRRAAEARRHLEAALTRLGELSTLSVRNMAFCSKVNSYGIYETYPQDEFAPGQQVLLYAELENFKCEETAEGFVTSVRSSYQIFDARGVRVESHDFATTDETCRNRRRDFFMRYFVDLPTRIYDGEYTLKLTIEDMKGQTSGEATIPFRIKERKE